MEIMTYTQIEGLIEHLINTGRTDDEELLSKIYIDLGMTGGNYFKLKFEEKTGKVVPDPYPSWSPIETKEKKNFLQRILTIFK